MQKQPFTREFVVVVRCHPRSVCCRRTRVSSTMSEKVKFRKVDRLLATKSAKVCFFLGAAGRADASKQAAFALSEIAL